MKIFLFIVSGLVFFGCFASWIHTAASPDKPIDTLTRSVVMLIAVVLFCTAAVIGAIQRGSKS